MPNTTQPHLVRSGVLQQISSALAEFGVAPEPLLSDFGLTETLIDNGDLSVDIAVVGALLERVVRDTGARHFPVLLSASQNASFLGGLWLILQSSNTLGEALVDISRYIYLHAEPVLWSVEQGESSTAISVDILGRRLSPLQRCLMVDLALAQCYRVLNTLTDRRLQLKRVTVQYEKLADDRYHRRYFGARIEYNADGNSLVLPTADLTRRIDHSDTSALHEAIAGQIGGVDGEMAGSSLDQEVRAIVRSLLPLQQCSIEKVAGLYGCDKRTLQRHLRDEAGTSYQTLLDETRYEFACEYLQNSSLALTQISAIVGFTEPSNFSRGFKQHVGLSPSAWRKQHRADDSSRRKLKLRRLSRPV